jgi:GAF domain-containing protein
VRNTDLSTLLEAIEALEGTRVGAWGWDVEDNAVRWAPTIGTLYGRERGYEPATYEEFLDLVHPTDADLVAEAVTAAIRDGSDYEIDFRVTWPDGTLHWLHARAHAVLDESTTRTLRVIGVVSDDTERKRVAEQNRFLATAGAMLGQSLDVDKTLHEVAELLVDGLADWCTVQLLHKGQLRIQVVQHREPDKRALVEQLQSEYPPEPEPAGIAKVVIESREPMLIEDVPDELLVEAARDKRHLELLRSLGVRSVILVPIAARDELLGIMTLASAESGVRFTDTDLAFAIEIARRAGLAIDNARLHQSSVRSTRRAELVSERLMVTQRLLAKLSQAADVAAVANAAVSEGADALGAARGTVVLLQEGHNPEVVASTGYQPDRLADFERGLGEPGPLDTALRTGRPVYVESLSDLVELYPNLESVMVGVDDGAYTAVPLTSSGTTIGVIGFVYGTTRSFSPEDRAFLSTLSQHVSLAIERSLQYDLNRSVAEAFYAAIAPPPVDDKTIPAAARYRAAGIGSIGGDWYDVIAGPKDSQFFVVGDVVGRGLEAVGTMAQLRHSLRMLLLVGYSPASALHELGVLASKEFSAMGATVICVEAQRSSGSMTITSAGHLPPIIVAEGRAKLVEFENGPPLGVGGPAQTYELSLAPDEFLVLYTDGAVERRDESIDRSLDRLCSVLASTRCTEKEIADALLEHAPESGDDVTILTISGARIGHGTGSPAGAQTS